MSIPEPCSVCGGKVKARGLCNKHYQKWQTYGNPNMERKRHRDRAPIRILDVLETDGGWLTSEGVALQLPFAAKTVDRALYRLAEAGDVEKRLVELAASTSYHGKGSRTVRIEWRVHA